MQVPSHQRIWHLNSSVCPTLSYPHSFSTKSGSLIKFSLGSAWRHLEATSRRRVNRGERRWTGWQTTISSSARRSVASVSAPRWWHFQGFLKRASLSTQLGARRAWHTDVSCACRYCFGSGKELLWCHDVAAVAFVCVELGNFRNKYLRQQEKCRLSYFFGKVTKVPHTASHYTQFTLRLHLNPSISLLIIHMYKRSWKNINSLPQKCMPLL